MESNQSIKSGFEKGDNVKGVGKSLLEPEALLNILEDLEEEKKRTEESEKKYELLFEESTDAIFWADSESGKIIKANNAAEKLLGRKESEIIGISQDELHPPEKVEYYKRVFNQHVREGRGLMEAEIVTKLGKIRNVEINATVVSIAGKSIVQGIFRDITERKKAEAELKRLNEELKQRAEVSEEKYKTIYESSADAIMILEPPTWKFTSGNPATIRMFGAKDEKQFITFGPWDISPRYQANKKLSSGESKKRIAMAMKKGSDFFEWTHKRLSGESFPATILLTKTILNGKEVLQATVRDITSQKIYEARLEKANRELKQLDVAKTDFLNMVSHELKTPLTAMMAHLEILDEVKRKCISRGTDQNQCGLSFAAIKRNNSQLSFLIDNLLEIARVQAKTFELNLAKFDIKELALEVINNLYPSASQKKLKIYHSIDDSLGLRADKDRVREILNNLLNNAIKFTEKGKITIRIKGEGDIVSISAEDSGVGIKKEDMPNLFKKFFQVEHGLRRGYGGGTGLGLTIVNQLVTLHGGKVFVESKFGRGSIFTVKLPVKGPTVEKKTARKIVRRKVTTKKTVEESSKNHHSKFVVPKAVRVAPRVFHPKNVTKINFLKGGIN